MKLKKSEKIWLAVVIIFYILYNLPFFPAYGNSTGAILHGILTLIPLWIAVYVGLVKSFRDYPLREDETDLEE